MGGRTRSRGRLAKEAVAQDTSRQGRRGRKPPPRDRTKEIPKDVIARAVSGLDEQEAEMVEALLKTNGNQSKAAELLGYSSSHGRKLANRDSVRQVIALLRGYTVQRAVTIGLEEEMEWRALLPFSQRRLVELANSKQDAVALGAVKEMLNRILGQAPAHIDHTVKHEEGPQVSDQILRLALQLVIARGWSMIQALTWVQQNQEEAEKQLALPPGNPAITKSIIVQEVPEITKSCIVLDRPENSENHEILHVVEDLPADCKDPSGST